MAFFPRKTPNLSFVRNGSFFQVFNPSTSFLFETTPLVAELIRNCNGKESIEAITDKIVREKKLPACFRKKIFACFEELKEKNLVNY